MHTKCSVPGKCRSSMQPLVLTWAADWSLGAVSMLQVDITALFRNKEIKFVTTSPSDFAALDCGVPHTS